MNLSLCQAGPHQAWLGTAAGSQKPSLVRRQDFAGVMHRAGTRYPQMGICDSVLTLQAWGGASNKVLECHDAPD
jgi:hypothetical protein